MCGICGVIKFNNQPIDKQILEMANNKMLSRGPDASGVKLFGNVGLAHRRLSIIDIASGQQPLCNEDETVWITFNGEIYNYAALRNDLVRRGHNFKTNSDTEVIVHLYESHGKECIKMLDGMFAFTIYDRNKDILLLARDRLGKKPLVYFENGNFFAFASELRTLTVFPDFDRTINAQAMNDFLSYTYIPAPQTIYKNAFKLLPGHCLEFDIKKRKTTISRYWKADFSVKSQISFEDAKSELRRLLKLSVEKRLMSEVPLGCFVSGGLDSAVVTSLLSGFLKGDLSTFTIGFDDPQYDERDYAKIVAEHFGTKHHVKQVTPSDFSVLENLIDNFGEPFADASMIPTYQLAGFARENITVALSGDGGDELFGGYYRYSVSRYANLGNFIPESLRKALFEILIKLLSKSSDERRFSGKARRILSMLSKSGISRYFDMLDKTSDKVKQQLYGEAITSHFTSPISHLENIYSRLTASDPIEKLMELDIYSYLPNDILTKVDIASMASSLEVRCPLLDYDVIDFVSSLPIGFKNTFSSRKKLLLEAFKNDLPKETYSRRKMGFGVPIGRWIKNEWKGKTEKLLLDSSLAQKQILNQDAMRQVLNDHLENRKDYSYLLFSLIVMELWHRKFQ
ncbi:MAG TPA: asparagine synthase (glutamine-hydrolyzing) [Lentisphaeria bacterium]|nr:MAG: asparagine synthase (glutamine-hydrolyzing) [Lentisphaerae bacterium GWF2_38_69]HBM15603.1 asparagine synthase (glutamine-hydrolyzing) [Lentisphaeria bacterium]